MVFLYKGFNPPFDLLEVIKTFDGHSDEFERISAPIVEFSDGRLVSMSRKTVKIWNRATGACENTIDIADRRYGEYVLVGFPSGDLAVQQYYLSFASNISIFSSITGDILQTISTAPTEYFNGMNISIKKN